LVGKRQFRDGQTDACPAGKWFHEHTRPQGETFDPLDDHWAKP